MAKQNPSIFNLIPFVLILAYLCIGFVPNLDAVDKIAPQWLIMGIINLASTLYILFRTEAFEYKISRVVKSTITLFYLGFFIWAGLSYFYAINPTEVLVNMARHTNTFFMYVYLALFIQNFKDKDKLFSWVLIFILSIEVYAVMEQAMGMFESNGIVVGGELKGVTANRNITAFSIAVKIPFVLFLLQFKQKKIIQVALLMLIFASIFCLTMISSRASFIAVAMTALLYTIMKLYLYKKNVDFRQLKSILNIIIPLLAAVLFNQVLFSNSKTVSALDRASTISVTTNDGSINQRLRYYEDVLTHLVSNPIFGTGIGNWKIKSIDYDKKDIKGYVVPYHAHSDFIQIGAELGIIGFLLYLGVFLSAVYLCYLIIRAQKLPEREQVFVFILLIALGIYTIDANLNFPIARPQVLCTWALILAFINFYYQKHKELSETLAASGSNSKALSFAVPLLGLFLIAPSVSIANTTYKSLKAQMTILRDFNSNQFNIPLNQIESFIPQMPNITVTTIPMEAIKARYYNHYKKYDKALEHLEKSVEANPYLRYSEILMSQIYSQKGNQQKAKKFAKIAFENLPSNDLHASLYINILIQTKDKDGLSEAFDLLTKDGSKPKWQNYLVAASQLFPPGDSLQAVRAKQAKDLFSGDSNINQIYKLISLGSKRIEEGLTNSNQALNYFNQGNHTEAVKSFEKAIDADPLEYSYRENAATSYYILGDLENALKQIDVVINDLNPLNGKCEYIKALIFLKFGDPAGACPLLRTSRDSGYPQAQSTLDQYCSNL
jgi:O-antigen ligase/protein involved in temperature-dependent protein secretion